MSAIEIKLVQADRTEGRLTLTEKESEGIRRGNEKMREASPSGGARGADGSRRRIRELERVPTACDRLCPRARAGFQDQRPSHMRKRGLAISPHVC